MKLNFDIANQIKNDFQYLVGKTVQMQNGTKVIKEIAVLPIKNESFGTFPLNYLNATDKNNFILPYKNREMSLIIYFNDNSFFYFFQFLADNNIPIDLDKYLLK